VLSVLLTPFSVLYGLITHGRNFLYDRGWLKSYSFQACAIISVGNLSVGGTGKTPMIEYLVRLLLPHYSLAVLSRGYGRQTKGYRLANAQDTALTLGDEPFQYFKKWPQQILVAVCEDRVEGITRLLKSEQKIDVVLLDDAFQHRRIKPSLSILLTDFAKPFFSDHLLPKGRLREARKGSMRAQMVVVTKCPDLEKQVETKYQEAVRVYAGNKPLFFSSIKYQSPLSFNGSHTIKKDILLVTAIANSKPLVEYTRMHYTIKGQYHFVDHHHYTPADVELIQRKALEINSCILTTEKDMVKLIAQELKPHLKVEYWFYLPIETVLLNSGSEFDKIITEKINTHLYRSIPE